MTTAPEADRVLRFACTACGACCNRSPEVALSEAAALADIFVFRLMFRLYEWPAAGSGEEYYQTKRLLNAFAARKYPVRRGGRTRYLMVSALTMDTGAGACTALSEGRCGIYERRPLACRTLPFHYSRPEVSAERELAAFVATPGYRCDTSAGAPVVLEEGRIVEADSLRARGEALALAANEERWRGAIMRRLKPDIRNCSLPSLREIEANAAFGATGTSMRVAWQIAAEAGLIGAQECRALIAAQAFVIDRALASTCPAGERVTLGEMRTEYRALLND